MSKPRAAEPTSSNHNSNDDPIFSFDEEMGEEIGWNPQKEPEAPVVVKKFIPASLGVGPSDEEIRASEAAKQAAKVPQNPAVKVTVGFHPKTQPQPLVAADKGSNHKAV